MVDAEWVLAQNLVKICRLFLGSEKITHFWSVKSAKFDQKLRQDSLRRVYNGCRVWFSDSIFDPECQAFGTWTSVLTELNCQFVLTGNHATVAIRNCYSECRRSFWAVSHVIFGCDVIDFWFRHWQKTCFDWAHLLPAHFKVCNAHLYVRFVCGVAEYNKSSTFFWVHNDHERGTSKKQYSCFGLQLPNVVWSGNFGLQLPKAPDPTRPTRVQYQLWHVIRTK